MVAVHSPNRGPATAALRAIRPLLDIGPAGECSDLGDLCSRSDDQRPSGSMAAMHAAGQGTHGERADPAVLAELVRILEGPRSRLHHPERMNAAEHRLIERLEALGWPTQLVPFEFENVNGHLDYGNFAVTRYQRLRGQNLIAERPGTTKGAGLVVVIAHLDTVRDSPGANDNTASVAGLVELARLLTPSPARFDVLLAATDMEEIGLFGARALRHHLKHRTPRLVVVFETMACTRPERGSQQLPPGIGVLLPRQVAAIRRRHYRGDFTALIHNRPARAAVQTLDRELRARAGDHTALAVQNPTDLALIGGVLRLVPAIRHFARSDHVPFWKAGIPAVQLTDTANFRYPHYHQPTDTPDQLDFQRLTDIIDATAATIRSL